MKLAQYLKENSITHSDFAHRIGVSQVAVTRYAGGARIPRPAQMMAIAKATEGAVKPDDFFMSCFDQGEPPAGIPRGHLSRSNRGGKRDH